MSRQDSEKRIIRRGGVGNFKSENVFLNCFFKTLFENYLEKIDIRMFNAFLLYLTAVLKVALKIHIIARNRKAISAKSKYVTMGLPMVDGDIL